MNVIGPGIKCLNCRPFPLNLQCVRWARKPIWMGTAKSKLFRIPQRPQIPEDEKQELQRLNNNYKTEMKSIKEYLTLSYNVKFLPSSNIEQVKEEFEADFDRCIKVNDEWNSKVKAIREKRIQFETEQDIEEARKQLEEHLRLNKINYEKAEEEIREQKEASKTFITPDKLEAAIEYAINNLVDYNYAIDLNGKKIMGRHSEQTQIDKPNI